MKTSFRRAGTAGRRLGLGVSLSAAIHLLALAALTAVVTRAGSRTPGEGATDGDGVIAISATEAAALAEAGLPELDRVGPELPPGFGRLPPASAASLPGTSAPTGSPTASDVSSRVATAAVPAPSLARPAAAKPSRPPAARRTGRRAKGAAAATDPAPAPALATPEKVEPAAPAESAPRAGTPGPSPRAAFLAQMKRHLRAAWRPGEIYQRIDPTGRLEGSMFISGMQVRLRADGTVERAELRDSSGIRDLDLEAQSTLSRMQPLPPLPPELVDARGGFDVRCSFHLDVGLFRFANKLHHAIAGHWRPSAAFAATSEVERKTIVKLMLDRQGTLVQAAVVESSGIGFLDTGAVDWAKPGIRFPPPPPAFGRGEGPVPVFVAFLHRAGIPRVLKPREDLEAE